MKRPDVVGAYCIRPEPIHGDFHRSIRSTQHADVVSEGVSHSEIFWIGTQKHRRIGALLTSYPSPPSPPLPATLRCGGEGGEERSSLQKRNIRKDGEGLQTLPCIEDGWNERIEEKENETMHKKTDLPHDLSCSFPLSTQRFLERPRGEGGDAKRRGVRTRESNHLLSKTNLFLDTLSYTGGSRTALHHPLTHFADVVRFNTPNPSYPTYPRSFRPV